MRKVKVGRNKDPEKAPPLYVSMFGVAPEYIIKPDKKPHLITVSDRVLKEKRFAFYSPMEVSSIFSHLAKVDDENSLLKFVHQFGLLGIDESVKLKDIGYRPQSFITCMIDDVEETFRAIDEIKYVYNHWLNLKKKITLPREVTWDHINLFYHLGIVDEVFKNANDTTLTRAYLLLKASKNLGGVHPTANFTHEGKAVPGFAYISLYYAVWHQLYLAMMGDLDFKECPHCQSWHTGQGRYCPPPPGYQRSPCQNAYNQEQYRKRTQKKNGL